MDVKVRVFSPDIYCELSYWRVISLGIKIEIKSCENTLLRHNEGYKSYENTRSGSGRSVIHWPIIICRNLLIIWRLRRPKCVDLLDPKIHKHFVYIISLPELAWKKQACDSSLLIIFVFPHFSVKILCSKMTRNGSKWILNPTLLNVTFWPMRPPPKM